MQLLLDTGLSNSLDYKIPGVGDSLFLPYTTNTCMPVASIS